MGIMDLFKRRMKKNDNITVNKVDPDCSLSYKSGVKADISFKGIEEVLLDDGTKKLLQKVYVLYNNPDKTFEGKDYYMEPVIDQNGNDVTKESYMQLENYNLPLLKGFFEKSQTNNEPTNYLGYIGYDQNNKPYRAKDVNFERSYKGHLDRKRAREGEKNELIFQQELREKCNGISVHIDNDQPEDLSKTPCPYKNGDRYNDYCR